MYTQIDFLESINSFLKTETSGALMISGAWGSGKTYYIDHTLQEALLQKEKYPIKISLFGLSNLDDFERRITELYLQTYGEEQLMPIAEKDKKVFSRLANYFSKIRLSRGTPSIQSVADMVPFVGQFVDVSRIIDAYTALCTKRLPKDSIVLILDDLERAVVTIEPHLLLGIINDLVETKKYKVIVIANDSYFNKAADNYLDFKEKVIERTLLFPPDIITVYKSLVAHYREGFSTLMSGAPYINIIDPEAIINKRSKDLQENLSNIRILKYSIALFAKIYDSLIDVIESTPDDSVLKEFLLSIWALTVGLSIEYKRNHITYLDRDAFIDAAAIESFVVDIADNEPSLFDNQESDDGQEEKEKAVEIIRAIFKKYIERHSLPLIQSVQVFDLVTAGISIDKIIMTKYWDEYRLNLERQKENPAISLLNRFIMSIWTFTNEEFPHQLLQLAEYTRQGAFPDDVSYVNAATFLQHYALTIEKSQEEIQAIITAGIDKHYENVVKLSPISKSNLDVISSEIPAISRWVVDYLKTKVDEQADKEKNEDIQDVILQFKEDLPALAKRLSPNLSSQTTPDFFTFPILSKIPEEVIVEKLKTVQPNEVIAISSILDSRFIKRNTTVPFEEEAGFILCIQKGIEARDKGDKSLSSFLIEDDVIPMLGKLIATPSSTEGQGSTTTD